MSINPIAEMVVKVRERLLESQEQFAKRLKVQQATVSRYESGKSVPGALVLMQLYDLALPAERQALSQELGRQWVATESPTSGSLEPAGMGDWQVLWPDRRGRLESTPFDMRSFSKSRTTFRGAQKEKPGTTDTPIAEIQALWAQYGTDQRALEFFRDAAGYLRVRLSRLK